MSEIRRLQDKLAKLSAAAEGVDNGGRNIRAADKKGLLLAVLHEIDETILARELTFQNDAGSTLVLVVAARRLLGLGEQTGAAKSPFHDTILGQSFSEPSEALFGALAALLNEFLEGTSKLVVRPRKLSRATDPSEIGCSAEALAQAWSLELYGSHESASSDRIEDFIAACAKISLASVRFDAENIRQKSGQEDELQRLVGLAQRNHSHLDSLLSNCVVKSDAPRCAILGSSDGNRQSILYVASGTVRALVMISSDQLADIYSLWRNVSE